MNIKTLLNTKSGKLITIILGIALIFVLWIIISFSINSSLFPTPDKVFNQFFYLFSLENTWISFGYTLLRLLITLIASLIVSLILGLFGGLSKSFYRFLNPLIILLRTLPTAAVIFVLVAILKPRFGIYIVVFLGTMPVMYEAVVNGVRGISKDYIDELKLYGSPYNPKAIFSIIYPMSLSNIIMGIVQSAGLGMKMTIMAEILCGSNAIYGIGRNIYNSYNLGDMESVFAYSIYAIIAIGITDFLIHLYKDKKVK